MKDPEDIVRRKEQLVARCEGQRARLGDIVRDLERPIAVADRAIAVARFLREHPLLTGAAVAAAVALRRHGPAGLTSRALVAWRTWRTFATWAGRLGLLIPRGRRAGSTGDAAS
jgi:hypothetical protein